MSLYYNRLVQLKREVNIIEAKQKKPRWKPNQKLMVDFIHVVSYHVKT
jgi:hypothetical protein